MGYENGHSARIATTDAKEEGAERDEPPYDARGDAHQRLVELAGRGIGAPRPTDGHTTGDHRRPGQQMEPVSPAVVAEEELRKEVPPKQQHGDLGDPERPAGTAPPAELSGTVDAIAQPQGPRL